MSDANWPSEISDLKSGFAGSLNVYRTMANHPDLLRAWEEIREHVVNQTALGLERSEVVILRTGFQLGSSYEWLQHIKRARERGLSDHRIAALKGALENIGPEDRVLATAVDELFEGSSLTSTTCEALARQIGKEGILDLMATVGFYSTLGFILNTFDTPLDNDIRTELAANPLLGTAVEHEK
ncbi:MAG: carboxymuconolactone decarboxylase family protein [Roseobacter sp.]